MKLGEIYRQGGVYNGRRILAESFVREAIRAQSGDLPAFDYGYLWWVTPIGTEPAYSAGTVRPTGRCDSRPPASRRHLQWLFPPAPSPEGQLLMVETDILPPTALGDESGRMP